MPIQIVIWSLAYCKYAVPSAMRWSEGTAYFFFQRGPELVSSGTTITVIPLSSLGCDPHLWPSKGSDSAFEENGDACVRPDEISLVPGLGNDSGRRLGDPLPLVPFKLALVMEVTSLHIRKRECTRDEINFKHPDLRHTFFLLNGRRT